ncbi:MAG TPA: sigma-70 family RNA polymerase sigma factor [Candidatus Angelobacter sp.]
MKYSSLSCDELVRACAESKDPEAWEEFVCRFERPIRIAVWKVAQRYKKNNSALIQDLVQDTFTKVCDDNCRLLRQFKPTHQNAFFGMLSIAAANVARDYFRASHSSKRGSGQENIGLDEASVFIVATSSGSDHMERQVLLQELDKILRSICSEERDREIFWLHYRRGLTAGDIAKINHYGLTAKGVESILHRLRTQLRTKLAERPLNNPSNRSGAEGIQDENTLSQGEGQL